MNNNVNMHYFCFVCKKRVDKVKNMKCNLVEDLNLLKKINSLKNGVQLGVCNRCSQMARTKFKNVIEDPRRFSKTVFEDSSEIVINYFDDNTIENCFDDKRSIKYISHY